MRNNMYLNNSFALFIAIIYFFLFIVIAYVSFF